METVIDHSGSQETQPSVGRLPDGRVLSALAGC
jgi:hypothetical protein